MGCTGMRGLAFHTTLDVTSLKYHTHELGSELIPATFCKFPFFNATRADVVLVMLVVVMVVGGLDE